jgi:hypothetical protein
LAPPAAEGNEANESSASFKKDNSSTDMSSTDVAQRKAEWEEGVKKFLEVATSTDGWTESHEKLGVQVHRKDTDAIAIIKVPFHLPKKSPTKKKLINKNK